MLANFQLHPQISNQDIFQNNVLLAQRGQPGRSHHDRTLLVDPTLGTIDVRKPDIDDACHIFQSSGSRPDLGHDVVVLGFAGLDASIEQSDFHDESPFGV